MKRYIRQDYTRSSNFSTFELDNNNGITASHIFIGNQSEREQIADDVFEFLNTAYDDIGGFKSFKDVNKFINDSYLWYITYDGTRPENLQDFDISKVYVVSVYRRKNGLKMVGMARRLPQHQYDGDRPGKQNFLRNVSAATRDHIRFVCDRAWAEVSGKLETAFHRAAGFDYIIDPEELKSHKVFSNIDVAFDAIHYTRPLYPGEEPIMKIAYGTIRF